MKIKPSMDFKQGLEIFTSPIQCLNEIVQAWTNYLEIAEKEKTKRCAIEAWEKTTFAEIEMKRDFIISYLERSFDERAKIFQSLFKTLEQATASGDNQQLSLTLQAITELAKTNPFKELSDISAVKANLSEPNHIWEF